MSTVDRTAVNQMIVGRLLERLAEAVVVYAPSEEAPETDDAWCKVHRVSITPLQSSPGADQRGVSFTITVCISSDSADASKHALDDAVQLVLEAIEHAAVSHSDGVHTLQIREAESDILTDGQHDADATGVVSVVGDARRAPA